VGSSCGVSVMSMWCKCGVTVGLQWCQTVCRRAGDTEGRTRIARSRLTTAFPCSFRALIRICSTNPLSPCSDRGRNTFGLRERGAGSSVPTEVLQKCYSVDLEVSEVVPHHNSVTVETQ
jgi:hypothetical protein